MTANFLFRNLGGFRFEEIGAGRGRGLQRRRRLPGGHGRRLRRPRRRRPARPGRDQLLRRVDDASTTTSGRGHLRRRDSGASASRRRAGSCSASAPPSSTPTTTAGSTWRRPTATSTTTGPTIPYAMPAQLLLGGPRRPARPTSPTAPARRWPVPRLGRGLAVGDLDNDGRLDLLIVAQNAPLAYFHNQTEPAGHFLTLRLGGDRRRTATPSAPG